MKCPACETDLRIDSSFVNNDGLIEVVAACQNDADRTEKCVPDTKMLLSLRETVDGWELRDYGD